MDTIYKQHEIQKDKVLLKTGTTKKLKDYLTSTDWYYARKAETGEEVPTDVVIKRKEAREFIRANEIKELK
jgi:hypothetical protein